MQRASPPAAEDGPSRVGAWVLAARPATLTAAATPVVVGTAVALHAGEAQAGPAAAAMLGALALQVGANLANDVFDFRRGADTADRIGPPRVTQLGILSERQVIGGLVVAFGIATLAGIYLVAVAGWPVAAAGIAAMLAALAYTGGPWPFGYHGLGDLFVFIFFGLVAVVGTYYVQAGAITSAAVATAVPVGCTVTAILMVNNIRDIETDEAAGKRTLAVMIGRQPARWLFVATVAVAYLSAAALAPIDGFGAWTLLAWLSVPLAVSPVRAVMTSTDGPTLNAALRATARLHLALGVLLAIGLAV
ncbi:MAG: 1,4-dihydroxy-2-naphthoate polyprenyltransferase [Chloroflexi bacterium]|nr:1,4-dihydroxy-2-naphthoate polyprenyltransferase [Chloroflexota bacterium]